MERFLNIIYYSIHRLNGKFGYYFLTCTGILKLYDTSFAKRRFKKYGIDNPKEWFFRFQNESDVGIPAMFAHIILFAGCFTFLFGLHNCFYPRTELPFLLLIVYFAISILFLHYFVFRKDKYLKYFKEFDKKSRKWKIKWAFISLGLILFSFAFFIWSLSMLK